jgi:uncharacterized membrane protein YgcG
MRTAALLVTLSALVAYSLAAREQRMMATTEIVKYWVKTDKYCYVTEKVGILGLKKLKECESESGGYDRNKRSVIIDDKIETTEEDFIMDKFISPSKPLIDIEKQESSLESSENPSRRARFFNKYIITFTQTLWLTKFTGTTSIKFKCTPRYSFIPACEGGKDKDTLYDKIFDKNNKNDKDDDRYQDSDRYSDSHGDSDRYSSGSHYGEGSYGSSGSRFD